MAGSYGIYKIKAFDNYGLTSLQGDTANLYSTNYADPFPYSITILVLSFFLTLAYDIHNLVVALMCISLITGGHLWTFSPMFIIYCRLGGSGKNISFFSLSISLT